MDFVGCWDGQPYESFAEKAESCASSSSLDFEKISKCAETTRGDDLLKAAAEAFQKKFPDRTCGEAFGVPYVDINGDDQGQYSWETLSYELPTYESLLKNLCAKGIGAAACRSSLLLKKSSADKGSAKADVFVLSSGREIALAKL